MIILLTDTIDYYNNNPHWIRADSTILLLLTLYTVMEQYCVQVLFQL